MTILYDDCNKDDHHHHVFTSSVTPGGGVTTSLCRARPEGAVVDARTCLPETPGLDLGNT